MITKWYTEMTYVDIHTGEIITKSLFEREYTTIETEKKIEINHEKNYGLIKKIRIGEPNRQLTIKF